MSRTTQTIKLAVLSALLSTTTLAQAQGVELGSCPDGSPGLFVEGDDQPVVCVRELTPQVSARVVDAVGHEVGGDTISFLVERSIVINGEVKPLEAPAPLDVTFLLGGNATALTDFVSVPQVNSATNLGTVTIPAGQATAEVLIVPTFDLVSEAAEDLTLQIRPSEGYRSATAVVTGAITDYAHNTVWLEPRQLSTGEGRMPATIDVSRSGETSHPLTVLLALAGNATQTIDYDLKVGNQTIVTQLIIPAGLATTTVSVTPRQDSVAEPVEAIVVRLVEPAGEALPTTAYRTAMGPVTVQFHDDEVPTVSILHVDPVVSESGAGTVNANQGRLSITRTAASIGSLTVQYATSGSAERGSDYLVKTGPFPSWTNEVTFEKGVAAIEVVVDPVQDAQREGIERLNFTLVAIAGRYNVDESNRETGVVIFDDDVPLINLTAMDTSLGERGDTKAALKLTRSGVELDQPLTVSLDYTGTANGTRDYSAPATVTLPANTTSMTFEITARDDSVIDDNETIIATLRPSGTMAYGVGLQASATLIIRDIIAPVDHDGDGINDVIDNCPTVPNVDQNNTDGATDGGNACDDDDDNDGLTDLAEAQRKTNPAVADTDGDGRLDGQEIDDGTNPLDRFSPEYRASDVKWGPTGTGIEVTWKAPLGSRASKYLVFRASTPELVGEVAGTVTRASYKFTDTGFPGGEHRYYIQAMLPTEASKEFNATLAIASPEGNVTICQAFVRDTDGDGLCDREEDRLGTRTDLMDSDGDGIDDDLEIRSGTNPLSSDAVPVRIVGQGSFLVLGFGALLVVLCLAILIFSIGRRTR